jgi:hypothetical protein
LFYAKQEQARYANKRKTKEPLLSTGQLVLLSTENINIPNVAPKVKPRWIGPFPVIRADYQRNNYQLNLSSQQDLSLIHNIFHISKLKPYVKNNDSQFPQRELIKPGPVEEDRYEIEKVLEFRTAPRTGKPQYKVRWLGYGITDDQWIDAQHITTEILQDFWTKGSLADTFKLRRSNRKGPRNHDDTKEIMQQERDRIMNLPVESASINIDSPSVAEQIFNLFMQC